VTTLHHHLLKITGFIVKVLGNHLEAGLKNQILSAFWNTSTSVLSIPFADYFQPSGIDLELLVPIEKRVKRAYPL
jgi:hypothetical protein